MDTKMYYGRGRDEENAQLIDFIDEVFFTNDPASREFLEILPKIYKDKYRPAYSNFVAQEEETRVFRSAIGNFYCPYTVGGTLLNACCIGNVAVGKNYRGMGYMIKLMEMSIEDMKANGTDLAYLGGQRQRYGYFGFEHAGIRYMFGFSRSAYRHALKNAKSGYTWRELKEDDTASIAGICALNAKNPVSASRPESDCSDILRSWRQRPFVLEKDGAFAGYLVFGSELNDVCEYGICDESMHADAVAAAFEILDANGKENGLTFIVGPQEKSKIDFFTANCDGIDMGGCEMILVFNFRKVIESYMRAKATYCTLADGCHTVLIKGTNGDENITITVKDNAVTCELTDNTPDVILDDKQATRAFFSLYPVEKSTLPATMQQWLPLPMYQSSCDTM